MRFIKIDQIWVKALLLIVMLLMTAVSIADEVIPSLKSHVSDLTATLSNQEIVYLEQKLAAFEKTQGSQVAVLIVSTTQPETIEQYSMRAVEAWKLGRKNIDDGVLLLIAKNDRSLRIEVGYGLEGALPDAMVKRIIAEIITPHFKQGHFAEGIDAGIVAILGLIKGESLPFPNTAHNGSSTGTNITLDNLISILIGSILLGRTLQIFLGRLAGSTVIGIGAGFIGWFSFSSIAAALLIAIAIFFINLFLHAGSGIYRGGRSNWSNHNYRSGGFGNSGSGGGGGGFGGGGASGRW